MDNNNNVIVSYQNVAYFKVPNYEVNTKDDHSDEWKNTFFYTIYIYFTKK